MEVANELDLNPLYTKGLGENSFSDSNVLNTNVTSDSEDPDDHSSDVLIIVQIGLGFMFAVFVLTKIAREVRKCSQGHDNYDPETGEFTVTCPLCEKKISNSMWCDLSAMGHRKMCSYKSLLEGMPESNFKCRKCDQAMRIWPPSLSRNPNFTCDEPHCNNKGLDIKNTGLNRMTCFMCDYSMCADCGNIELKYNTNQDGYLFKKKQVDHMKITSEQEHDTVAKKKRLDYVREYKQRRESLSDSQMSYSTEPTSARVRRDTSPWALDPFELGTELERIKCEFAPGNNAPTKTKQKESRF